MKSIANLRGGRILLGTTVAMTLWLTMATDASAASVTLSVNGGASVTVVAGTEVTLAWEAIDLSGCSINNGVGPVAQTGTRKVIPPDTGATYVISCEGVTDSAVIDIRPRVNIWSTPSTVTPPSGGSSGPVTLSWLARNATKCTKLTAYGHTSKTTRTLFNNANRLTEADLDDVISQTTTYTLTCVNVQTGRSNIGTHKVYYEDFGPPEITEFTSSEGTNLEWDPEWNGAYTNVRHDGKNATRCERRAYRGGTEYDLPGWTATNLNSNTTSWVKGSWHIVLASTTRLSLRCGRTSDNRWVTESLTINVSTATSGAPAATEPWVTLIAPPLVSVPTASDLPALVNVETNAGSVNRCSFLAYDVDGDPISSVPGWTDRSSSWYQMVGTFDIQLTETTRLVYQCTRTSDNRVATTESTVVVSVQNTASSSLSMSGESAGVKDKVPAFRISWVGQNVNTCRNANVIQSGDVTDTWYKLGVIPLSGVYTVSVYGNTTYQLTCVNSVTGQSVTDEISVDIVDGELVILEDSVDVEIDDDVITEEDLDEYRDSVTISVDPRIVRQNEVTTVTWTAHVDLLPGCVVLEESTTIPIEVDEVIGDIAYGSFESAPLRSERTFSIRCDIPTSEPVNVTANVRVLPRMNES